MRNGPGVGVILALLISLVCVSPFSEAKSRNSARVQKEFPQIISYRTLMKLSPKKRAAYVRGLAQALAEYERGMNQRLSLKQRAELDSLKEFLKRNLSLFPEAYAERDSDGTGLPRALAHWESDKGWVCTPSTNYVFSPAVGTCVAKGATDCSKVGGGAHHLVRLAEPSGAGHDIMKQYCVPEDSWRALDSARQSELATSSKGKLATSVANEFRGPPFSVEYLGSFLTLEEKRKDPSWARKAESPNTVTGKRLRDLAIAKEKENTSGKVNGGLIPLQERALANGGRISTNMPLKTESGTESPTSGGEGSKGVAAVGGPAIPGDSKALKAEKTAKASKPGGGAKCPPGAPTLANCPSSEGGAEGEAEEAGTGEAPTGSSCKWELKCDGLSSLEDRRVKFYQHLERNRASLSRMACMRGGNISNYKDSNPVPGNCLNVTSFPPEGELGSIKDEAGNSVVLKCAEEETLCSPLLYCGKKADPGICVSYKGDVTLSCDAKYREMLKAGNAEEDCTKSNIWGTAEEWDLQAKKFGNMVREWCGNESFGDYFCLECSTIVTRINEINNKAIGNYCGHAPDEIKEEKPAEGGGSTDTAG